jgi:hypothetical protein
MLEELLIKAIISTTIKDPKICKHFNKTFKTQKYSLKELLPCILNIVKYGYPWRFNSKLKEVVAHWFDRRSNNYIFG